jgi:hypothetical protein
VTQQTLPLSQTNATAISDEAAARATAITNEAAARTARRNKRYRYRNKRLPLFQMKLLQEQPL